jgi:hypothetical protein
LGAQFGPLAVRLAARIRDRDSMTIKELVRWETAAMLASTQRAKVLPSS